MERNEAVPSESDGQRRGPGRRQAIGIAATVALGATAVGGAAAAYDVGRGLRTPGDPTGGADPRPGSVPQADPDLSFIGRPADASALLPRRPGLIAAENLKPGTNYRIARGGATHKAADDVQQQVKGYTSAQSVALGESLAFHVHTAKAQDVTIEVFRLGFYGGRGGRSVLKSAALRSTPQPPPSTEPALGTVICDWQALWTLDIPVDWVSGVYLAVLSIPGFQNYVPFVVRDDTRAADFLVILPFTTYQAYNQYPLDGKTGKSLYLGYQPGTGRGATAYVNRSAKVSYDRPWSADGWPPHFEDDVDGFSFLEAEGYDVVYATSLDLHSGRVDPRNYKGVLFTGHDEYWSAQMRRVVAAARDAGTHLAFLSANSMYWNIRVEQAADGRTDRTVVCYKDFHDPVRDRTPGTERLTRMWRDLGRPEQSFVGVQVVTQVFNEDPLTIAGAEHWFWAGTGARDGDTVRALISGEADGQVAGVPLPEHLEYTVLAASAYHDKQKAKQKQNTVLYQAKSGAWVFCSGTFAWNRGLSRLYYTDKRVQQAMRNLLDRMRA